MNSTTTPEAVKPSQEQTPEPVPRRLPRTKKQEVEIEVGDEVVKAVLENNAEAKALDQQVDQLVDNIARDHVKVCEILHRIQEGCLYVNLGFKTYDEYATTKRKLGYSTVMQYADIGRVKKLLDSSNALEIHPTSIRQLQPLTPLSDSKQIQQVWKKAEELAKAEPKGGPVITGPIVVKAKAMVLGEPKHKTKPLGIRMEKALADIWKDWYEDEKESFIYTAFGLLGDYFELLDEEDFSSPEMYATLAKFFGHAKDLVP